MRTNVRSGRTAALIAGIVLAITSPVVGAPHGGGGGDGTLPPVASITSGPDLIVDDSRAEFHFEADQPEADFVCSLDGATAVPCTSPATFDGLSDLPTRSACTRPTGPTS